MLFVCAVIVAIACFIFWHMQIVAAGWAVWFFLTHLTWMTWVLAHPWRSVAYTAGYFLAGAAWSVVKWWFAETDRARKCRERWKAQQRSNQSKTLLWDEFKSQTDPHSYRHDIYRWIGLWPFSAVFTLLDDPLRRVCRRIYNELLGVYQRITDHVWK